MPITSNTDTKNYGSRADSPRVSLGSEFRLAIENRLRESWIVKLNPWPKFCCDLPFVVVYAIAYYGSGDDIKNNDQTDDCTSLPLIISIYLWIKFFFFIDYFYTYYFYTGERCWECLCGESSLTKILSEMLLMTIISIWATYDYFDMSGECLDANEDVGSKLWRVAIEIFAIHSIVYFSLAGCFCCCLPVIIQRSLNSAVDFMTFEDNNV